MDSTTQATIDKINAQISVLEEEVSKHKGLVNTLCALEKEPPLYPDVDRQTSTSAQASFRPDQFFGQPMATAVKEVLQQRFARNAGAISLDDLFATLKAGGFEFDNANEQIAKRNLAITVSKNPAFMKVPSNGHIGLAEWYPNAKRNKKDKTATPNGDLSGLAAPDHDLSAVTRTPAAEPEGTN